MFRSHHVTVLYRYRGLIYTEYSSYAFVCLAFALVLVFAFALALVLVFAFALVSNPTLGERDIKCISIGCLLHHL